MSVSASSEVFEIQEMLYKIVCHASLHLWWRHQNPVVGAHFVREMLRSLVTLMQVNRAFLAQATLVSCEVFGNCLTDLALTDRRAKAFVESQPTLWTTRREDDTAGWTNEAYNQLQHDLLWAKALYDQHSVLFPLAPRWLTVVRLEELSHYRRPRDLKEVWHLASQHCYYCGTRCKDDYIYSPGYDGSEHSVNPAELTHPYEGTMHSYPQGPIAWWKKVCDCRRHELDNVILPHTGRHHMLHLEIGRGDNGRYYMMLALDQNKQTIAETQFRHFKSAAARQPWYEQNLMRLFANRPKALFPCVHEPAGRRRNMLFHVTVFMLRPAIDLGPDTSIAGIFELSNAEALKVIARGRRLDREIGRLYTEVN